MNKNCLPVGSVVLLRGGAKKLMIIGIQAVSQDEDNRVYDYMGVLYPEGFIGEDDIFLFDHADINDVVFTGYDNPERQEFLGMLEKIYEKKAAAADA